MQTMVTIISAITTIGTANPLEFYLHLLTSITLDTPICSSMTGSAIIVIVTIGYHGATTGLTGSGNMITSGRLTTSPVIGTTGTTDSIRGIANMRTRIPRLAGREPRFVT